MITGKFTGIPDSWEHIIKEILLHGEANTTEYGDASRFINGLAVELTEPREMTWHKNDPFCSKNRIEEYKKQFQKGYTARRVAEAKTDKDKENVKFKYTYMDLMTDYDGLDQIEFIVREFKKGRYESRRLRAITWRPKIDADPENTDQPCLQSIYAYPRPNKTADFHVYYRSWDMFKGYPGNINALLWTIRTSILEPTGFRLNALRCFGDNCHIYGKDLQDAMRAVGLGVQ